MLSLFDAISVCFRAGSPEKQSLWVYQNSIRRPPLLSAVARGGKRSQPPVVWTAGSSSVNKILSTHPNIHIAIVWACAPKRSTVVQSDVCQTLTAEYLGLSPSKGSLQYTKYLTVPARNRGARRPSYADGVRVVFHRTNHDRIQEEGKGADFLSANGLLCLDRSDDTGGCAAAGKRLCAV